MVPTSTRKPRSYYGRRREAESHSFPCSSFCCTSNVSLTLKSNIAGDHNKEEHDGTGCYTPKGKKFRIPEILSCPPAPMKPRVSPKLLSARRPSAMPITFFASPDIDLFFFLAFHHNVSPSLN